jgi:hypothetical protein
MANGIVAGAVDRSLDSAQSTFYTFRSASAWGLQR